MRILQNVALLAALALSAGAPAEATTDHDHAHVEHNMVLYGTNEIFASHIVFKNPHHYQVILGLDLPEEIRARYTAERAANPGARFIYLLDPMSIGAIETAAEISGTIFRRGPDGEKIILARQVRLPRARFKIIFFNTLPESLAP